MKCELTFIDENIKNAVEEKQKPVRREGKKVGRNDPCPCGSGKKYKKCCLGTGEKQ